MKFDREEIERIIPDQFLREDSEDELACFGEFSNKDIICTEYCSASIRCAIEHNQNPKTDIFEHLLNLNFFPAKIQ